MSLENDYRQPRTYELMTVLIPDLEDEATTAEVEKVQGLLTSAGQLVHTQQTSPWGRRRLAYTIRHNGQDYRDGYYLLTYFTAHPDKTEEIERELKLDQRVMRYLLLQSEPFVPPAEEETEGELEGEAASTAAAATAAGATSAATEPTPDSTPADGTEAAPAEQAESAPDTAAADAQSATADEVAPTESDNESTGDAATESAEAATSDATGEAVASKED